MMYTKIQGYYPRNYNNSIQKQRGFNILESMAALALLSIFTISFVHFKTLDAQNKDAKILSQETSNYAVTFARYMKSNQAALILKASGGSVILSPDSLGASWPIDLAKQNIFHQIPCLSIVTNSNTKNLEAIMYYVGGNSNTSPNSLQIVRDGSIFLGSKGGILLNKSISGNSGWEINSDSPFLADASKCGANLSNNSLAVNLDLFLDWNQTLQPSQSLLRGLDNTPGTTSLPGHIKNANTSKSNLYFSQNSGIILDNSDENPVKLSVQYNGQGTGAATIGIGDTQITSFVGDTFRPNIEFQSGQYCTSQEVGKTVLDHGLSTSTNSYLARSTLVCTQNNMLCGNGNYCYLPTVANNIVFRNTVNGIQDGAGNFYCPTDVPFATNYTLSNTGGQVYVFMNNNSNNVPNYIDVIYENTNGSISNWTSWNYFGDSDYFMTDFNNARDRAELLEVDLATIKNASIGTTNTSSGQASPITGSIGQYSVMRGFSIKTTPSSCSSICSSISGIVGHSWQILGTQRALRGAKPDFVTQNQNLGCACERTDFSGVNPDNYTGVAAVIGAFNPKLTSVTCSNKAVYQSN